MPNEPETIQPKRTELVWPGKYNVDGSLRLPSRVQLPFQVIESVNESRADREARKGPQQSTLFEAYAGTEGDSFDEGWRNKVVWGDNLLVAASLTSRFAGQFNLIYIDPPFASGQDFSFTAPIGEDGLETVKEASLIEEKAYRDTWGAGLDSYLQMMSDRVRVMRDLLRDDGSIFVHCDWHVGHMLRCLLDEVFGPDNFVNEIVWYYYNKMQGNVNHFASNHDVIFWYRKGSKAKFKPLKEKRLEGVVKQLRRVWDKETGKLVNMKGPDGKVVYQETDEKTVDDVWRISMLQPADRTQNVGYPTQKPEALLERIIEATTDPGDLVGDFFCGSGTTLAVAEKMGRRWVGSDMSRWGVHTTRKRLLEIADCKPFEILNLGRYERQHWQATTFKSVDAPEKVFFEYLSFILKLYSAQPIAGFASLHGKRGNAMVHVGTVDAPVTIHDISTAIDDCLRVRCTELHVLGWEWEMGLQTLIVDEAKKRGVKLVLIQIPREVMERQAVDQGDIRFFELAYMELAFNQTPGRKVTASLMDFAMATAESIPAEIRGKISKWSDLIDYWAVDWDFKDDTFVQGYVAYRTQAERSLPLKSDPHTYQKAGKYRAVVKVVDIFGNDTSQAFTIEVK